MTKKITQNALSQWITNRAPIAKWTQSYLKFYESHIILENLRKSGLININVESVPKIHERKKGAREIQRLRVSQEKKAQKAAKD